MLFLFFLAQFLQIRMSIDRKGARERGNNEFGLCKVYRDMRGKKLSLGRLLIAGILLTVLFMSASVQIGSTPNAAMESPTVSRNITLGQTDTSITPLLNKIIVLYLRNQGIHVKELSFKDPSRLPLALEHKVIDTYWDIWSRSPQELDQREILISRPVLFIGGSKLTGVNIGTVSELIRYVQEHEVRLKIAVDKNIPLDKIELGKWKQAYGWQIDTEDLVQLDASLFDTAFKEQWVDMAIGWSSDVRPMNEGVLILNDDLKIFPSYQIMPRFHESNRALLEPLFHNVMERLTREKWLALQYQVDILGEDASKVAMQFLIQERLMSENKSK